ncbi:MAG: efflux RND transporter permease subunit [Desulforhopalus sp.]
MKFEYILRHNTLIAVVVLILCVLGITAALSVPVQMIPDLEVRTINVDTFWPGATPQDVEKEILIEQEQYLRTLPNLRRMVSTANSGQANIVLEFPFGVNINEALIRTNNALSQVSSYPENVDPPALTTYSFSDHAFMYFRIRAREGSGLDLDLPMLRDFLEDNVRPRLERVPGISTAEVRGVAERQVRIMVDPHRLAERGLDMTDVRDALRARNIDRSAGDLDSGKHSVLVRSIGRFKEPTDIGNLIVTERQGSLIRLSELAKVELSHHEISNLAFSNGAPSLMLSLRRETGSNVIQTKYAVLPEVEAINREVMEPAGLEMELITEDARYVEKSVANIWNNLMIGAVLAAFMMYAFLRSIRTTFTGVIAIPICTIAAFVGLLLAGRTLNVISMAGVAFAIGMTVDNTIVVLESIIQARQRGMKRFDAAIAGVGRVWPAVLACSLTTVLVFAPILFIQEEAGQLYSDIAIAISASILASMAAAVTVVPALSAHIIPSQSVQNIAGNASFDRIGQQLGWFHRSPLRRGLMLVGTVVTCGLAVLWLTPPAEYLPEGEEARIFAFMTAPPGYNLTEMKEITQVLIDDLRPHLDEAPGRFDRGETDFPAIQILTMLVDAQSIMVIIDPKNPDHIEPMMGALQQRFLAWPGMRAFATRGSIISSNDGGTRSINLNISGANLAEIYHVASLAYARATTMFDGGQVDSQPGSLSLDQPMLELKPHWERLTEVGLDAERFGYSVAALSDGAYADEMILNDRRVDIYLFSDAGSQQQLNNLRDLPVATPSGAVLPLSALADLQQTTDTDSIRRLDGRRTVTLSIIPPRSVALETGVARVRSDLIEAMRIEGEIPQGVLINISGASDQLDATREAVSDNFVVAVLLSYLMLVAIFGHWGRPLFVMASVPMGLVGGLIGLALLNSVGSMLGMMGFASIHQPFDMITLLGFLVLLGTVVNNPILIVQETYKLMEEGAESIITAVNGAVRIRLRAILMSSLTTICGIAPLVLIPGEGTELYRGLGAVVLFGVAFSTIVTLTFLPCLMVTIMDLQQRADRVLFKHRSPREV